MSIPPRLSFVTLDVFTQTPFSGNPVSIVNIPRDVTLRQDQKQRIAREFNLSETVFLHEQTDEEETERVARLDIFNPVAEHPFAGHPTVGTANYLLRLLQPEKKVSTLILKAGKFGIKPNESVDGVQIALAHAVHVHADCSSHALLGKYPVVSIVKGMTFILPRLNSVEELAKQTENIIGADKTHSSQSELDDGWQAGMIGSYFYVDLGQESDDSTGASRRRIRTRMFSRREDPGTGSAASALVAYLSLQEGKAGEYRYHIAQGVEMGQQNDIYLEVVVRMNAINKKLEVDQVLLSGTAVLNMEGTVPVPQ
ncbi:hypothetical protein BX600DRAFT_459331 [Xylariales sp. PMI_506]|nr:hypothetical protein BX600DRAFT_459331 [Xylariales sp. PMI_506]